MISNKTDTAMTRREKWLRRLAWLAFAAFGLLLVAYFVLTSNTFIKDFILPRLSRTLNAKVTVREASFSPFSHAILYDLRIQTEGREPVLTVKELRANYVLTQLLGGKLSIQEVVLESPSFKFLQKADGTSNLDFLLHAGKPASDIPPNASPFKSSQPFEFDLKKLVVNNAAIQWTHMDANDGKRVVEMTDLSLELSGVGNGKTASLSSGSILRFSRTQGTNTSKMSTSIEGAYQIDLDTNLFPQRIKGQSEFAISSAAGAFANAKDLNSKLTLEITPREIRQLAFNFTKAGALLGNVVVKGPFNPERMEGKLDVNIHGIGREVLGLAGGRLGIGFEDAKLAATSVIELKNQAQWISAVGALSGNTFSLSQSNLTTLPLEFRLDYNLTLMMPRSVSSLSNYSLSVEHQTLIKLTPTPLSLTNHASLTGKIESVQSNRFTGYLDVRSENLDLTGYQNLLLPAATPLSTNTAPESATVAVAELPAFELPLRQFKITEMIGRLHFRELLMTNFISRMVIDGSQIQMDTVEFALNGAPVKASAHLDLSVPGYAYEVGFEAKDIPLAPFATSFQPAYKDKLSGTLSAIGELKGAGTAGASLPRNLTGGFKLGATNLNLAVTDVTHPVLRSMIEPVVDFPAMLMTEARKLGPAFEGMLTNYLGDPARLAGEWNLMMSQSPLDALHLGAEFSQGIIHLQPANLGSPFFTVSGNGTVTLAPRLMESKLDIPLSIGVHRSLAEKVKLAPANTNEMFVELSRFNHLQGTMEKPISHLNLDFLKRLILDIPVIDDGIPMAGQALGVLKGILSGQEAPSTNAPPSVPGSTNNPPVLNHLNPLPE